MMGKNMGLSLLATAICLLIFFSLIPKKESLPPPINPFLQKALHQYRDSLEWSLKRYGPPGVAIAIVKDSNIVLLEGLGKRSVEGAAPVDEHTVFRIGSLSKGFTAVLCGLLAAEGQLSLEDKVIQHLPNFALHSQKQSQSVAIKHLLSHTSGLPYHTYTNLVEYGTPIGDILPQLRSVPLISKEGEIYAYQNAAFSLIEPILDSLGESSFEELLAQRIFQPLQMHNSSTSYEALMRDTNTAKPHRYIGTHWGTIKQTQKYYSAISAGGINASISDMAQWMIALLGHRPAVIPPKSLDRVFSPVIHTPNRKRYFRHWPALRDAYYAMGWRFLDYNGQNILYHGGFVNNYRAEIAIDRKNGFGICVLMNAPSDFTRRCIPSFLDAYLPQVDSIQYWEQQQLNN
ncbi:MAG: serine hydrolase domain-containing protein [Bacteroidota bacterium]